MGIVQQFRDLVAFSRQGHRQGDVTDNGGQEVVVVVCNAAGQCGNGFHAPRFAELQRHLVLFGLYRFQKFTGLTIYTRFNVFVFHLSIPFIVTDNVIYQLVLGNGLAGDRFANYGNAGQVYSRSVTGN